MKISRIYYFIFLIQLINSEERSYNSIMPDLPSKSSHSSLSISTTRKIYSFSKDSFSKINLSNGPFNVKLYQNENENNNYTSVDIETEELYQKLIEINIIENNILSINLINNINLINKTNITIIINYLKLTELNINGFINIQCLNYIQTDTFYFNNYAHGFIKLKIHLNYFYAYLHSIGKVKLCGQVNNQAIIQSIGLSDILSKNLFTKKINIISSGIGNIYITATDEINIILSGISTVYYTGPLKQHIINGLGNIIQIQH